MTDTASAVSQDPFDAIIIGAGMSGLAAGIRLALFNRRVLIVDRHKKLGGLNSYYKKAGLDLDVGLHAVTNYVPKGTRGKPLTKLLRQLRLSHDDLGLWPQRVSEIRFPSAVIRFSNGIESFRHGVLTAFPGYAHTVDRLLAEVAARSVNALDTSKRGFVSARQWLRDLNLPPLLIEMLMCPIQYYGSPSEHDIDLDQFVIMFEALFAEGLARPREGVRRIIRVLESAFKRHGGQFELGNGVARLVVDSTAQRVVAVELESGRRLTADLIFSSAGHFETTCLRTDHKTGGGLKDEPDVLEHSADDAALGKLSFVEVLTELTQPPATLGLDTAIVFFSTVAPFAYCRPTGLVDSRSGVICCPTNYAYPLVSFDSEPAIPNLLRITAQANFHRWRQMVPTRHRYWKNPAYQAAKAEVRRELVAGAAQVLNVDFRPHIRFEDVFTPLTIARYTYHPTGAVYGAEHKVRDGRTDLQNLFLCGTDQGFLGITGALLSGITIANLHGLKGETALAT